MKAAGTVYDHKKSSPMKRIVWRDGRVFSLKLRNNKYALLQMLSKNGQVAVFNCFRDKDEWDDVRLSSRDVLFACYIVKTVLQKSNCNFHKSVRTVDDIEFPELSINISGGFRKLNIWGGSEYERTLMTMGNGQYGLYRSYRENGQIKEEYTPISLDDYDKYTELELTNLREYPEFNERLYLCSILERNIDPLKEIAFEHSLDLECRTYIDIISGNVPISQLGY